MACFKTDHVHVQGVAAAVPRRRVSNLDLELLTERERTQLVRTTGIEFRRVADASVCASDLCFQAACDLMAALNWSPESIDLLVFVSQTPDLLMPGTASQLQVRLGLGNHVVAMDLNQGCAGYIYGLSLVASMMAGGHLRRGLLLVGDTITHVVSPEDKSTVPIFSDAGSATALEFGGGAAPMFFNLQTDGNGYRAICIPEGGGRIPFGEAGLGLHDHGGGIRRSGINLAMQGLDVFNFALAEVAPNIRALLEFAQVEAGVVDAFVFHQANLLLNESIRRKMNLAAERVPYSLREFGNTSSATSPVTMVHCMEERLRSASSRLVLSGFGVGLSWGSALVQVGPMVCLPMIEC
jgi:3-oxoacyl-[acyl-carrier-protein] synthase III